LKVSLFGSGPCEKNLRKLVGLLELTNVEFLGQVEDIERVWQDHHGLVLPSRLEGLPISLVEAMLCSRMGIVTDVAGNTEIMEDGVTGFVAAAPTVVLLDQALERAWERRLEWRQMGLAARKMVLANVPPDPVKVFADTLVRLAEGPLKPEPHKPTTACSSAKTESIQG
jgi:glycosyltransferase involved in cell wall biosynthesis